MARFGSPTWLVLAFLWAVAACVVVVDIWFILRAPPLIKGPIAAFQMSPLVEVPRRSGVNLDGFEPIRAFFEEAGIPIDEESRGKLPQSYRQIVDLYGAEPVVVGLDSCERFRDSVPAVRRMLGAAGMFSTGTNLVTQLLKSNCQIPERVDFYGVNATKEAHGMRWQVPWGKHTPAHYRLLHATDKAKGIVKEDLLPVVTIRHPWRWMQSMCHNPYTARWRHRGCPSLKLGDDWNPVSVKYGAATENYSSLAHLFNDWYHDYYSKADYPFVMIRMEDLVFHTKSTIRQVCECAGGAIRTDRPFRYVTDSAKKDSPGHDTSTGLLEAWIKYSQTLPRRMEGLWTREDYEAALESLDQSMIDLFHYQNP